MEIPPHLQERTNDLLLELESELGKDAANQFILIRSRVAALQEAISLFFQQIAPQVAYELLQLRISGPFKKQNKKKDISTIMTINRNDCDNPAAKTITILGHIVLALSSRERYENDKSHLDRSPT
jgi:hypothetical protein